MAEHLAELGLILDAAEAFGAAAGVPVRTEIHASRSVVPSRSVELRPQLHGVDTPALRTTPAPAVLSEREREVALLAASGRRDADIVAELVVSVRTVHAHLRSVYTKLGITSRSEIAAALAKPEARRSE